MIIYKGMYTWDGWGKILKLGSGKCFLQIINLEKADTETVAHLRPILVVVSDIEDAELTVRSCAGHIATSIIKSFNIEINRMLYMEYYPERKYGDKKQHTIPEKFDIVDFKWVDNMAIEPKWRPLKPPMLSAIKKLISHIPH